MKISARNQWNGKVAKIARGPVSTEVTPTVATIAVAGLPTARPSKASSVLIAVD